MRPEDAVGDFRAVAVPDEIAPDVGGIRRRKNRELRLKQQAKGEQARCAEGGGDRQPPTPNPVDRLPALKVGGAGADLLLQFGRSGRDTCGGAGLSGRLGFRDGWNDVRGRGFGGLSDRLPDVFGSGGRFERRRGFRGAGRELVRRCFESAGARLDEFGEIGFGLGGLRRSSRFGKASGGALRRGWTVRRLSTAAGISASRSSMCLAMVVSACGILSRTLWRSREAFPISSAMSAGGAGGASSSGRSGAANGGGGSAVACGPGSRAESADSVRPSARPGGSRTWSGVAPAAGFFAASVMSLPLQAPNEAPAGPEPDSIPADAAGAGLRTVHRRASDARITP